MTIYSKCDDLEARRERVARDVDGRLAMYRLLVAQRQFANLDDPQSDAELERAEGDRDAHRSAPPGTVFVSRTVHGDENEIWVLGEGNKDVYCGPRRGYPAG